MTTIEVLPNFENLTWEVKVNGEVYGYARSSCDADFHANVRGRELPESVVLHYAESRREAMTKMDDLRNAKRKHQ